MDERKSGNRMGQIRIGVVGPCAAGKTTLVQGLRAHGYTCHHIAQEHSYVADMWRRLTNPDILVYLEVSYPLTIVRRALDWTPTEYAEQLRRLEHARDHADLVINTDHKTQQEILEEVLREIESRQLGPSTS